MDVPSQETVGLLSSDEGGAGSSDSRSDSSEDEVTEHVARAPAMAAARAQVVVPTISVTPHSPGVLDDSLQQLRQLHAAVQRMRAAPLPLMQAGGISRLSTSCPSLCKDGVADDCCSPTHLDFFPHSRKGSGESRQWGLWDRREEGRRSSWAALEPGARGPEPHRQRSTLNGHSASLSSVESDGEAPRVRHSTHSLNDNDLAKDFEKVTAALRAGAGAAPAAGGARLAARLPLQKSVSTPSIVAAVQPPPPQPQPSMSVPVAQSGRGRGDAKVAVIQRSR